MSHETKIDELIASNAKVCVALEKAFPAGIAAAGKAAAGAADDGKNKGGRPKKVTAEQVDAMANKVKEAKGAPAAKALIAEYSKTGKLAGIPEDAYAKFMTAAEVALNEDETPEEPVEEDL